LVVTRAFLFVALGLNACAASPFYNPWQSQREVADSLRPHEIASADLPPATFHFRVRVLAADDYRAGSVDWRGHIEREVQRVNDALRPYSVEFTIERSSEWMHRSRASLADDLSALETFDAGADVDLVIGFVSALPVFTTSQHQLGYARVLGKHLVLRGMEDSTEYDALTQGFDMLPKAKLQALYYERKRHKEAAAFIHEWGHTLGAPHTSAREDYMYASYDAHENGFSTDNAALVRVALEHPDGHTAKGWRGWYQALLAAIERHAARRPSDADEQEMIGQLEHALQTRETGARAEPIATAPPAKIPASAPVAVSADEVREISEKESGSCKLLGLHRIDWPSRGTEAEREAQAIRAVRIAVARSGGDSATRTRQERAGKVSFFATVYRCR
jgi:hypothetical protein